MLPMVQPVINFRSLNGFSMNSAGDRRTCGSACTSCGSCKERVYANSSCHQDTQAGKLQATLPALLQRQQRQQPISSGPAKMLHALQQAARSAKHASSARPAAESESSQKQEESTGSVSFTPAQQAVATALMVVVKRALIDGKQTMYSAKQTLEMNNPATHRFLRMLPDYEPLPTMKQIEQRASDQLLQSLTKLAEQCAAAQCQPLEVFARSMQCGARMHDLGGRAAMPGAYDWQLRQEQQGLPADPPSSQGLAKRLQRGGLQDTMAALIAAYWQAFHAYSKDHEANPFMVHDLEHLLPGRAGIICNCWRYGFQLGPSHSGH